MAVKKINGYRIFLEEKLGKGAYGSVHFSLCRSIKVSKMIQKLHVPLKSLIKQAVLDSLYSKIGSLFKGSFNLRNQNYEISSF